MINFMDKLKAARQSELAIQAETEHIERLHRIAKLPGRPLEYSIKIAEKLAKLEKRLNASIDLAVDRKNEALNLLDNLSGNERTVLYQYYILAKDWRAVSETMYLSERMVFNLRKSAINKLVARYMNGAVSKTENRAAGE